MLRNLALAEGCVAEGRVVAHHSKVVRIDFDLTQIDRADSVVGIGSS